MTTPNQNTELNKAIESHLLQMSPEQKGRKTSELLRDAAKRLKEVEKDNWYNSFVDLKLQFSKQDVELSTLRTEYKKALEALKAVKSLDEMEFGDESLLEANHPVTLMNEILSTPLAIATMKRDR